MKRKSLLLVTGLLLLTMLGCGNAAPAADGNGSSESVTQTSASSSEESTPSAEESAPAETPESTPAPTTDPAEEKTLKEVFSEHNMKVGTCLTSSMIDRKNTNKIILTEFNSVTMENSMKPDAILSQKKSQEKGSIVINFNSDAIKMMDWAKKHNFSMRGHTLIWYSQTPEWIFHKDFDTSKDLVDRDEMLSRMETLIRKTFEEIDNLGYTDIFYAYDVVNEAWMENGTMRKNLWSDVIGDDYLWYAFYYANKYAPESIDLYYNDYNEQMKTQTLIDFVNTLVDEDGNYLIDGVGFQAHLYTSDNLEQYFKTVDAVGATGLKIQLTELDVCLGKYQSPLKATDENLRKQGKFYYELINGLFERVDSGAIKMDALTFWGFADSLSWRREYSPLLYNSSFDTKYAFYGALQYKDCAGY